MPRNTPVSAVMTTDVLSFRADERVEDAMRRLVQRGVDGGPVVDDDGVVVGMLTSDDLIVQETRIHMPTVVSLFGATIVLPGSQREVEEEIQKAVGAEVRSVMEPHVITCRPDDTVEQAATLMHEHHHSRLPVVDADGRLVGIIARGDILKAIVGGERPAGT